MRIRAKYVNRLVSAIVSITSGNCDCWCVKTVDCPCSECQNRIDAAEKVVDKLHKLKVIRGDDLRVIKPKKAVMR